MLPFVPLFRAANTGSTRKNEPSGPSYSFPGTVCDSFAIDLFGPAQHESSINPAAFVFAAVTCA